MDSKSSVIFNLLLSHRSVFIDAPEETRKAVENVLYSISFQKALDPSDLEMIKAYARVRTHVPGPEILKAIEDFERGFHI